jgi:hypothetical protein
MVPSIPTVLVTTAVVLFDAVTIAATDASRPKLGPPMYAMPFKGPADRKSVV